MRHALLAAPALLLAACTDPLLFAELEIPEVQVTLPSQPFPASTGDPSRWCDPTRPACVATDIEYDLGQSVEELTDPNAEYEIRLTSLAIDLVSGSTADLGGVVSAVIGVYPPAGGAPITVARYDRSPADPAPTAISVAGDSDIDLAPYLDAGKIRVRVEMTYDAPTPAFDANVTGDFYVKVKLDYGSLL